MSCFAHSFTVEGGSSFPVDMLRYDRCFPKTSTDVGALVDALEYRKNVPVRVTLVAHNKNRTWLPTADRWQSFGWHILDVNHTTL